MFSIQREIKQQALRMCFDALAMGRFKMMTHNVFCLLVANILDNRSGAEVTFLGATTRVWFKN